MRCRVLLLLCVAGCSPTRPEADPEIVQIPTGCSQWLVVRQAGGKIAVEVTAYETGWRVALPRMKGTIGRAGFAPPGQKREGDGKTPSGMFAIRQAFGYDENLETGLRYRRATEHDYWIDDAESPEYNRWVVGKPKAKSFEVMRRPDDLYKVGAVIEYNTDPVTPGHGSAIFLHVWGGPESPTAGCVAVSEADLRAILRWLSSERKPVILLNP